MRCDGIEEAQNQQGTEYIFFYGKGNETDDLGTGFFVTFLKYIISLCLNPLLVIT
jgi:hypothetical protein